MTDNWKQWIFSSSPSDSQRENPVYILNLLDLQYSWHFSCVQSVSTYTHTLTHKCKHTRPPLVPSVNIAQSWRHLHQWAVRGRLCKWLSSLVLSPSWCKWLICVMCSRSAKINWAHCCYHDDVLTDCVWVSVPCVRVHIGSWSRNEWTWVWVSVAVWAHFKLSFCFMYT